MSKSTKRTIIISVLIGVLVYWVGTDLLTTVICSILIALTVSVLSHP